MTIKETFKQTHSYARPVIWKIICFHLLALLTISAAGLVVAILVLAAKFFNHPIIWAIAFLVGGVIGIYSFLWFTNSMVGKLQFIIDSRNNLNPKVLTLWKNVFKFNWRTIGACFILSLLFIPFAILNSHDNVHAGHVAQHVQSNHQILIDEIYNIAMFLICPLMYIAVTRIYLTNASAWKSTKYSFSLALRKHPQIWLVAVIYYALTSLLPTLLIISDIQIMVVFGSILSFIFISSYFVLEPYYISYYLIQVYDDIANNPKLFIEK